MDLPNDPHEISLLISGDYDTTGEVTVPGLSLTRAFSFSARGAARVTFDWTVCVASSDAVEDLGVRVTASRPVTVCGLNHEHYSSDTFLALPVQSCGGEYYVLSYRSYFGTPYPGSRFTVVCLADDTAVTVTPTVSVGTRTAGVPFSITMDRGQTYGLVDLGSDGDMTGTHIVSDKPVAVFSGDGITQVPAGTVAGDHLIEQLIPVAAWDICFRLVPFMGRTADVVRILAASDGTNVSWNGSQVATLDAGQFYEGLLTANAVVTADRPVLVAQYAQGGTTVGTTGNNGDPLMLFVPGERQFRTQYSFCTPTSDLPGNYVNLIVPAGAVSGMRLDGAPVSASLFTPIDADYLGAQLSVAEGIHVISGPVNFGLIMYGFGSYDSYGNAGG
ncbi:MAG: IgGFc-binding protein [Spirochaetales bacterium]|nr:IgGFc-binding protein [Spirochaetales bacterium]